LDYHVTSPKLKWRLVRTVAGFPEKEARTFLDDAIARNPDRWIQAIAYQAMADERKSAVDFAARLKTDKGLYARLERGLGKAAVAQHIADGEKAPSKLEEFTRIMREKYADVIPDLSVGRPAPALVGEDLDGKPASLADLKGKLVVLDVWATWCGYCTAMIPHERAMVRRFEGKSFVLVSICADDKKETLKAFLTKEAMPWTHWWSGPDGKLLDALNVRYFPTIFVLDPEGVIRYTGIQGEELEKAVNTLLNEAETKAAE
jgi:thiol-disulfide isomerase/thioredoxin